MTDYIKMKFVEWSKINKSLMTPPSSPEFNPAMAMQKQNSQDSYQDTLELGQETPRSGSPSSDQSTSAFDNVNKALTGRLSVTIVEGRKLDVANYQSRPYCVVEFERHEVVTKEAIKQNEISMSRNGKSVNFLDLVRAATNPVWKQKAIFVSIYERIPGQTQQEIFLGMLKIQPPRHPNQIVDGWYKLSPRGKENVTGEIRVQLSYEKIEVGKSHLKPSSFDVLKLIGKGNFGKVFQVRKKDTNRIYAMKVLQKQDLIERREVEHTLSEKNILIQAGQCPFLVGLKFSFQTKSHLYLVTDFMNGGELFWHLQNEVRLSEDRAKFYAAEIVLALEHLHRNGIVYRDLKPENILLDANGHIALCDFGLCKESLADGQTTNTFCGTSEYLAPEVLVECGYGKSVDWWSLGILFYEMIAGFSPFYTNDTQLMYRRILFGKLKFPKGFFSDDAKSLIKGLLQRNSENRLGSRNDAEEIKNHPFFANVDWDALYRKRVSPPFKPNVSSEDDTSCFDPAFTEEETSIDWPTVSKAYGTNASATSEMDAFGGFTYSGENNQYGYQSCSGEASLGTSTNSGNWKCLSLEDALGY
ncbi:10205_t:CDS:2 [Diversispora eburnea]|uniref:non-specific serine/threonine protein kinase n=1 Tax=Diversispora eburnea TaxID=1213867 RepID=A0A9N9F3H2_9GLOM|nr:10205_t:CDS:2 [Diversispora eburnea]